MWLRLAHGHRGASSSLCPAQLRPSFLGCPPPGGLLPGAADPLPEGSELWGTRALPGMGADLAVKEVLGKQVLLGSPEGHLISPSPPRALGCYRGQQEPAFGHAGNTAVLGMSS